MTGILNANPALQDIRNDLGGKHHVEEQDDYGICLKHQIYRGSSSKDVVCRCCGTEQTSGSWRRGWKVRAIIDNESREIYTPNDEQTANLCNRYV